jgi:hypothetical protein
MAMSHKRHQQILSSVTAAALKVYDAVPLAEHWSATQILRELTRNGRSVSPDHVSGCLDSLRRTGLIKENRDGFCREAVKPEPMKDLASLAEFINVDDEPAPATPKPVIPAVIKEEPVMQKPVEMQPVPSKKPAKKSVVDLIADLGQQLAAIAKRQQGELAAIADLIADVAVDVQAELEEKDAGLGQLRQLQALLKNIGG